MRVGFPLPGAGWTPILTVILLGIIAMMSLLAMDGGVDDASIVYRYADRCAHGAGLTFNDGERVEGYTSLTWTLLLTVTCLAGIPPAAAGAVLNWIAIVLTALVLERLLRRLGVSPPLRLITLLLYAVSYPFFAVCYLGLEFGLYALLLSLLASRVVAAQADGAPPREARLAGLFGGLLFATRPESALLLPLLLAVRLPELRRRPERRRGMIECAAVWVGIAAIVTAWRLGVYGEILPNSMLAKSPTAVPGRLGPPAEDIRAGLAYIVLALRANPLLPLILAGTAGLMLLAPGGIATPMLLLPVIPSLLVSIVGGGDWMPNYRFVWINQPLLLGCFAVGAERLRRMSRWLGALYVVLAVGLAGGTAWREARLQLPPRTVRDEPLMAVYARLGKLLNARWDPADIAMPEAIGRFGAAGPRLRIHDPCGLTDRALAHDTNAVRTYYGRQDWRLSLSLNPALIILHFPDHARDWPRLDPRYPDDYVFGRVPVPGLPDRPLYVILRRDREAAYGPVLREAGMSPLDYSGFAANISPP
ncbi:MAG: hypothetical protein ACYDIE_11315 [Candidatus Krumholzibacteriia bacterium]